MMRVAAAGHGAHALEVALRHVRNQLQGRPALCFRVAPVLVGGGPEADFAAAEDLRVRGQDLLGE